MALLVGQRFSRQSFPRAIELNRGSIDLCFACVRERESVLVINCLKTLINIEPLMVTTARSAFSGARMKLELAVITVRVATNSTAGAGVRVRLIAQLKRSTITDQLIDQAGTKKDYDLRK